MKNVVQDLTSAGIDWQREKWQSGLGSKFIHQGEKNAAKYADEVIVLSKGVQDYFKETYGRKTHFIPNGVNRPQIREANLITEKFGLKKDSFRQTKAEKEEELAVVQEELQQKKQIAGNTEVLLTANNLQQYVKKIEVDHKKNTYTEFVF